MMKKKPIHYGVGTWLEFLLRDWGRLLGLSFQIHKIDIILILLLIHLSGEYLLDGNKILLLLFIFKANMLKSNTLPTNLYLLKILLPFPIHCWQQTLLFSMIYQKWISPTPYYIPVPEKLSQVLYSWPLTTYSRLGLNIPPQRNMDKKQLQYEASPFEEIPGNFTQQVKKYAGTANMFL